MLQIIDQKYRVVIFKLVQVNANDVLFAILEPWPRENFSYSLPGTDWPKTFGTHLLSQNSIFHEEVMHD